MLTYHSMAGKIWTVPFLYFSAIFRLKSPFGDRIPWFSPYHHTHRVVQDEFRRGGKNFGILITVDNFWPYIFLRIVAPRSYTIKMPKLTASTLSAIERRLWRLVFSPSLMSSIQFKKFVFNFSPPPPAELVLDHPVYLSGDVAINVSPRLLPLDHPIPKDFFKVLISCRNTNDLIVFYWSRVAMRKDKIIPTFALFDTFCNNPKIWKERSDIRGAPPFVPCLFHRLAHLFYPWKPVCCRYEIRSRL